MLSGVAAPCSGAGVRARPRPRSRQPSTVIGTLRPLLAERGALAAGRDRACSSLRRELAAIRRAPTAARGRRSTGSPAAERQRLNGRLGAGLETASRDPARAGDAVPAGDPGACAREARSPPFPHPLGALALGAVAAGEAVAAAAADAPADGARRTGSTNGSRSTGAYQAGVLAEAARRGRARLA